DIRNPILPPGTLFLRQEDLFSRLKQYPRVDLQSSAVPSQPGALNFPLEAVPDIAVDSRLSDPLTRLKAYQQTSGRRILIGADTAGRREVLRDLFKEQGITLVDVETWDGFLQSPATYGVTLAAM